ncbi:hypothetical protein GGR58DRAFT_503113 [Xylaria digitata]|nr:hypothetical protein GGR58DRAFT_503113 [Xylaria digitata]
MCSFVSSEEATDQWIGFHALILLGAFDGLLHGVGSSAFSKGEDSQGAQANSIFGFMDAIGLLSRSIDSMQTLVSRSISNTKATGGDELELVERFVADLESYLGVNTTRMSIADRWEKCPPAEGAACNSFYYDGYHEFAAFRKDYEEKYRKPVYVGPCMGWKRDRGAEVTEAMKNKSL